MPTKSKTSTDVARKAAQARRAAGLPSVRKELQKAFERGQRIHVPTWAEKKGVSAPSVYSAINRLGEEMNINRVTIDGIPQYELKTKAEARKTAPARKAAAPRPPARSSTAVVRPEIASVPTRTETLDGLPVMDEALTVCLLYRNEAGGLEVGLRNGSKVYRAEIKSVAALP